MDSFKHFAEFGQFFLDSKFLAVVLDLSPTHTQQSVFRPLTEPVESATGNKTGEHAQTGSEIFRKGRHTDNNVDIAANPVYIGGEEVHFSGLKTFGHTFLFASICDFFHLFVTVKIRDVSGVQDVIDVFQHLFIDYLCVYEQEAYAFVFNTSLHEQSAHIFLPSAHRVALSHFDLEHFLVGQEAGQTR